MAGPFRGCFVPLITPFNQQNRVDEEKLRCLVRFLIDTQHADGLIPCGTTGESPTLLDDEWETVIRVVVDETRKQVPVIAGTGSNATEKTIRMTKKAQDLGVDGCLVVVPYYNRPSQDGMYEHFRHVAISTELPVIVYNIPIRAAVNMENSTLFRLMENLPNIVGVKDAAGDLRQSMELIRFVRSKDYSFSVLCGEDLLTYAMLALGSDGVIAAAANIAGMQYKTMCDLALAGDLAGAEKIHYDVMELTKILFSEPNPTAIKACFRLMGMDYGEVRLPLIPASEATLTSLKLELTRLGL